MQFDTTVTLRGGRQCPLAITRVALGSRSEQLPWYTRSPGFSGIHNGSNIYSCLATLTYTLAPRQLRMIWDYAWGGTDLLLPDESPEAWLRALVLSYPIVPPDNPGFAPTFARRIIDTVGSAIRVTEHTVRTFYPYNAPFSSSTPPTLNGVPAQLQYSPIGVRLAAAGRGCIEPGFIEPEYVQMIGSNPRTPTLLASLGLTQGLYSGAGDLLVPGLVATPGLPNLEVVLPGHYIAPFDGAIGPFQSLDRGQLSEAGSVEVSDEALALLQTQLPVARAARLNGGYVPPAPVPPPPPAPAPAPGPAPAPAPAPSPAPAPGPATASSADATALLAGAGMLLLALR